MKQQKVNTYAAKTMLIMVFSNESIQVTQVEYEDKHW
jgi:hypothetical protein